MKTITILASILGFLSTAAFAKTTPMTEALTEEKEITIACELTEAPKRSDIVVFDSAKQGEAAKGLYHYKLWLPKGYLAEPQKRWPCMFIFSPGGNASMGNMADHLKTNGFVVVMLVESKNGPWEPLVGNSLAAHDDVIKRVRVDLNRRYATGMSGGARGASVFVQARPGFAGLILQGAGLAYDEKGVYHSSKLRRDSKLRVAMTMGDGDSNKGEMERTGSELSRSRYRVFEFKGGHVWAPSEIFAEAMAWITEEKGGKTSSSKF
jgi:predicted peptidase